MISKRTNSHFNSNFSANLFCSHFLRAVDRKTMPGACTASSIKHSDIKPEMKNIHKSLSDWIVAPPQPPILFLLRTARSYYRSLWYVLTCARIYLFYFAKIQKLSKYGRNNVYLNQKLRFSDFSQKIFKYVSEYANFCH